MNPWISHSNTAKQTALAIGCGLVGVVLMIAFREFSAAGGNARAGFFIGVLLLVIAVAALLTGKQSVVVNPRTRSITVENSGPLGSNKRVILFSDITDIRLGYQGKRSNFVQRHFLVLMLKSGEEYSLFAPGRFYEGGSNEAVVMGWRNRLQGYLRAAY